MDPMIGKVIDGRFEVTGRIGEGGHSVIYRASQVGFGIEREVALKILASHVSGDPEWVARFHASARALARVSHESAVQIFDSGKSEDDLHYIAMELVEGTTLRDELTRNGALPPPRALAILAQAARALGAMHARGIVHRDVKPESLLITGGPLVPGTVKLLFSSVLKTSDPDSPHTPAGKVLGTPWYMSPEQVKGARLGPPSDLYAAAVVLYEMIAGRRPFEGEDAVQVAVAHLRQAPPPLPDAPGLVAAIVERGLAKDPASRYQSGEALAADCEQGAELL